MRIRKIFPNIQSAHIVRNCTSERCSHSIHGHSTTVEIVFSATKLDNAQMVMDFGLMKGPIKQLIDSMDHCYLLCTKDNPEFCKFISEECDRYITMPFNPSAEMLSVWLFAMIDEIMRRTTFNNGESSTLKLEETIYHETASGSAECSREDVYNLFNEKYDLSDIKFSEGVMKDWGQDLKNIYNDIQTAHTINATVSNPVIPQQIKL